mmetsp:Transcript_4000/g.10115  ORF Transcript_4000/g.10115 Transcript_4000/m.10115 type:complete len:443 (+) Transcript_4000:586-1914(+)
MHSPAQRRSQAAAQPRCRCHGDDDEANGQAPVNQNVGGPMVPGRRGQARNHPAPPEALLYSQAHNGCRQRNGGEIRRLTGQNHPFAASDSAAALPGLWGLPRGSDLAPSCAGPPRDEDSCMRWQSGGQGLVIRHGLHTPHETMASQRHLPLEPTGDARPSGDQKEARLLLLLLKAAAGKSPLLCAKGVRPANISSLHLISEGRQLFCPVAAPRGDQHRQLRARHGGHGERVRLSSQQPWKTQSHPSPHRRCRSSCVCGGIPPTTGCVGCDRHGDLDPRSSLEHPGARRQPPLGGPLVVAPTEEPICKSGTSEEEDRQVVEGASEHEERREGKVEHLEDLEVASADPLDGRQRQRQRDPEGDNAEKVDEAERVDAVGFGCQRHGEAVAPDGAPSAALDEVEEEVGDGVERGLHHAPPSRGAMAFDGLCESHTPAGRRQEPRTR